MVKKRSHTDTTLKLPSDFVGTVQALLKTPPPPKADEILKTKRKRARKRVKP